MFIFFPEEGVERDRDKMLHLGGGLGGQQSGIDMIGRIEGL